MKKNTYFSIYVIVCLLCSGCNSQHLSYSKTTRYGIFKYSVHDTLIVIDLVKTCDEKLEKISEELMLKVESSTIIEIYPDQEEYDKFIMNYNLRGSPAISGNGKIQIVSPVSKIKIDSISYQNRLLFLVHEYVHLLLDQLETSLPVFLDEGLACYYGSFDFYHAIIEKYAKEFNYIPTIDQLQNHYNEIPAADVYSFVFIEFLINSEGRKAVSAIIRKPEMLVLQNSDWIKYFKDKYQ